MITENFFPATDTYRIFFQQLATKFGLRLHSINNLYGFLCSIAPRGYTGSWFEFKTASYQESLGMARESICRSLTRLFKLGLIQKIRKSHGLLIRIVHVPTNLEQPHTQSPADIQDTHVVEPASPDLPPDAVPKQDSALATELEDTETQAETMSFSEEQVEEAVEQRIQEKQQSGGEIKNLRAYKAQLRSTFRNNPDELSEVLARRQAKQQQRLEQQQRVTARRKQQQQIQSVKQRARQHLEDLSQRDPNALAELRAQAQAKMPRGLRSINPNNSIYQKKLRELLIGLAIEHLKAKE